MGNFENVKVKVDLKELYKDNPNARLTVYCEGVEFLEKNVDYIEITDYICVYIYDNYLEQKNLIEEHLNANVEFVEDINTIFYSERCVTENNDNIFISAYYCLDTQNLDTSFYTVKKEGDFGGQ